MLIVFELNLYECIVNNFLFLLTFFFIPNISKNTKKFSIFFFSLLFTPKKERIYFVQKGKNNHQNYGNAISLSEKDINVNSCAIFSELNEYKFDIFLVCLGAVGVGTIIPVVAYFKAKTKIALNSIYETVRYDDGLKYSFIFFAFAVLLAIFNYLMIWKFMGLGLTLARIYRKN